MWHMSCPRADLNTQRTRTDTHICRRQTATPAGLKGKHPKALEIAKTYASQRGKEHTQGHAFLRGTEMCAHDRTYWRRRLAIREVDRNGVSGSNRPIPPSQENRSATGSSQWRERRQVARLEEGPLTDAATHGHAVLLRVKVVSVAATSAVKERGALPFRHIKVPAGDHCSARPGLGLFRAHL